MNDVGDDGLGVDLTFVNPLVAVLDPVDPQVPLPGERVVHLDPLVVDDRLLLERQNGGPLVRPHHLHHSENDVSKRRGMGVLGESDGSKRRGMGMLG